MIQKEQRSIIQILCHSIIINPRLSQHNMGCCPQYTKVILLGSSSAAVSMEQPPMVTGSLGKNFRRKPYNTIGMVFLYWYCKDYLSWVWALVCVCVCTKFLNDFCEQAVLRGTIGWSLAVVPQKERSCIRFLKQKTCFQNSGICLQKAVKEV